MNMKRILILIRCLLFSIVFFFFTVSSLLCAEGDRQIIRVGNFSTSDLKQRLPVGWEELFFKNIDVHTKYGLVDEKGQVVVKAESGMSSSGLIKKMPIKPADYPVIHWSWKVSNVYEKGDVKTKSGDDYPARIYITFAYEPEEASFLEAAKFNFVKMIYGEYPPASAINYIWANKARKGTITPNPFTNKTMMIVVESGPDKTGQWLSYSRNVVEDYKLAFGESPPPISGVAIMTDSDNTGESATGWYGDIILSKGPLHSSKVP